MGLNELLIMTDEALDWARLDALEVADIPLANKVWEEIHRRERGN